MPAADYPDRGFVLGQVSRALGLKCSRKDLFEMGSDASTTPRASRGSKGSLVDSPIRVRSIFAGLNR